MNEVRVINKKKCCRKLDQYAAGWDMSWTWDIVHKQLKENNCYEHTIACLADEIESLQNVVAVMKKYREEITEIESEQTDDEKFRGMKHNEQIIFSLPPKK